MCVGHTLFPRSLHFELPGGTIGDVQYRGGTADVLKRECGGREVAIKAFRARGLSLGAMTKASHRWLTCIFVRIEGLTVTFVEVLQGGHNLEISPTSKCVAPSGGDHG